MLCVLSLTSFHRYHSHGVCNIVWQQIAMYRLSTIIWRDSHSIMVHVSLIAFLTTCTCFIFQVKRLEVCQCLCWRQSICRHSVDEYQIVNGTSTKRVICLLPVYIVSHLSSCRGDISNMWMSYYQFMDTHIRDKTVAIPILGWTIFILTRGLTCHTSFPFLLAIISTSCAARYLKISLAILKLPYPVHKVW